MNHDKFGAAEVLLPGETPILQNGCKNTLWLSGRFLLYGLLISNFQGHFQIYFTWFQSLNRIFLWELCLASQKRELLSDLHEWFRPSRPSYFYYAKSLIFPWSFRLFHFGPEPAPLILTFQILDFHKKQGFRSAPGSFWNIRLALFQFQSHNPQAIICFCSFLQGWSPVLKSKIPIHTCILRDVLSLLRSPFPAACARQVHFTFLKCCR